MQETLPEKEYHKEGATYDEELQLIPACFGYVDDEDPSCRLRCKLRAKCKLEQERTRPPCYGEYDDGIVECKLCLDRSQCLDEKEKRKMPKIMIKKPGAVAAALPAPVVEEPTEEELAVEEEVVEEAEAGELAGITADDIANSDWFQLEPADLRVECQKRGLDFTGKKEDLVYRLVEDDLTASGEDAVEEPVPATKPVVRPTIPKPAVAKPAVAKPMIPKPAAAVAKPTSTVAKPAAKPVMAKPTVAAPAKPTVVARPAPVKAAVAKPAARPKAASMELNVDVLTGILQHLEEGKAVVITCTEAGKWAMKLGNAPATRAGKIKVSGKQREELLYSDEFKKFAFEDMGDGRGWIAHTPEEKYAIAEANSITWEKHESPKLDVIRMSEAVRNAFGVSKYKPEYQTRAARDAALAAIV